MQIQFTQYETCFFVVVAAAAAAVCLFVCLSSVRPKTKGSNDNVLWALYTVLDRLTD